jgi:hypothetical protein
MTAWNLPKSWYYEPIRTILLSEGYCPRHESRLYATQAYQTDGPPVYCGLCGGVWTLRRALEVETLDVIMMHFTDYNNPLGSSGCNWRSDDLETLTEVANRYPRYKNVLKAEINNL